MKLPAAALTLLLGSVFIMSAAEPRPQRPNTRSPEIASDGKVTFRLMAPKADAVAVQGQWPNGRTLLEKGSDGVWSATVDSVPAGVWEYSLNVDGLTMIDPGNPAVKPQRTPNTSILQIPGNPSLIFDFRDVPHGVVRSHDYISKSVGRVRPLSVYTPPGYDQKTRTKYPVLFLQHGSGDNQSTWTVHGKAHWILDNLIAEKKCVPMIVVMMDGHAFVGDAGTGGLGNNTALMERDLIEDVMPYVEANYRVKSGPANRAIVGLSMGGGHSLTIGLHHTDLFGYVGAFSAATPQPKEVATALDDAKLTNKRLKLLWIGIGKNDFLLQMNTAFEATLTDKGIRHEYHLTEGTHSWPIWRGYLADFAPRLFQ
jgi:enterochelin esterase-like enzyme